MGDNSDKFFEKMKDQFLQNAINTLKVAENEEITKLEVMQEKARNRERKKIYDRTITRLMILAENIFFDRVQLEIIKKHLEDVVNYRLSTAIKQIHDLKWEEKLREAAVSSEKRTAGVVLEISQHLKDFFMKLHIDFLRPDFFMPVEEFEVLTDTMAENLFDINEYFREVFNLEEDFTIFSLDDIKEITNTMKEINASQDPEFAKQRISKIGDIFVDRAVKANEKLIERGHGPESTDAINQNYKNIVRGFRSWGKEGNIPRMTVNDINLRMQRYVKTKELHTRKKPEETSSKISLREKRRQLKDMMPALNVYRQKTRPRHEPPPDEESPVPRTRR